MPPANRPPRRRSASVAARTLAGVAGAPARLGWRVILIALVSVIVYSNSLGNPFVFDDNITLANNPQIRSFANVFHTDKGSALTGRPIVSLTFAANYALGGLRVAGYRIVNIALHVACALLLFGIVRRTIDRFQPGDRFSGRGPGIALAAALVWAVHPLNSEVVDYLTQRTEALMALFYLLTMYASVRALSSKRVGAWVVVAIVSCGAGMLCKEPMATAPLMVLLYDRVFAFESLAAAFRARWRLYVGLAVMWIPLVIGVASQSRELSGGFATTHVSAWSYLLNQSVIVTHYLTLAVWPQKLVAYYGWSLPVTLAQVWPYAAFLVAGVALSAVALVRWPRVGFLLAWFFVTLAPTSSILPIAAEVGADRRMYVPLMGLVVLAACGVARALDGARTRRVASKGRAPSVELVPVPVAAMFVLILAVVALGGRTMARNLDYSSELRLSETTLAHWPSPVAHDMVGLSLAAAGRMEEAIGELRQAVELYPPARYDLGVQYYKLERFEEAIAELQRFVALEPGLFTTSAAHTLIGGALDRRRRPLEAIDAYRRAVSGPLPDVQAHGFLADLLLDEQKYEEAIQHYRLYLQAYPGQVPAMMNLGIALASTNQTGDALSVFRRAVDIDPTNVQARVNLTQMLLDAKQVDAAVVEAQQTVTLAPRSAPAYDLLGQALVAAQRLPDARRAFERALAIDAGYAPAREHLKAMK